MSQPSKTDSKYETEYSVTNSTYLHYDSFSWQVGSVLVAAVFVFLGFLMQPNVNDVSLIAAGSTIVSILMSTWILYADHNRQIYLQKLDRIHQLELYLGYQQHLRWISEKEGEKVVYGPCRYFGPSGHSLNKFVYITCCLSPVVLGVIKVGFNGWFILPVAICFVVICVLNHNENELKEHRAQLCIKKPFLNILEPSPTAYMGDSRRPKND